MTLSDNHLAGDLVDDSDSSASFADKNVGTGKPVTVTGISISGPDAHNYSLTSTATSTTASITSASLTVIAAGINRVYDAGTDATVSLSDNRLGNDAVTESYAGAAFLDKNVGTAKTVTVSGIAISGTDAGNYTLQYATTSTTANITPPPLTVTATGVNRVYDANTDATVSLADNRLGHDAVSDSYTGASFTSKNVGTARTVNVSGISISGTDASNYTLQNTTAATTANITPRALTVTATGINRVYDASTDATVSLSDNRLGNDVVTDSDTAAAFTSKNVGTARTVQVSGIAISGTDAGNYTLQNVTATTTANITPAPLTVTATGINRRYDANSDAAVSLSDDHLGSDVITDSYATAAFSDKNVGTAKTVHVSGITIGGADAGNYTLENSTASTSQHYPGAADRHRHGDQSGVRRRHRCRGYPRGQSPWQRRRDGQLYQCRVYQQERGYGQDGQRQRHQYQRHRCEQLHAAEHHRQHQRRHHPGATDRHRHGDQPRL